MSGCRGEKLSPDWRKTDKDARHDGHDGHDGKWVLRTDSNLSGAEEAVAYKEL